MFSRSEGAEFKLRRKKKKPITAHPLFVPALALWGAALAGLAVFVQPASLIDQIAEASALTVLGGLARIVFAVIAAAIGAAILYFIATAIRGERSEPAEEAARPPGKRVRAIDPRAELGSASLDDPIADEAVEDEYFDEESAAFDEDETYEGDEDFSDADDYSDLDPEWVEDLRADAIESFDDGETEAGPNELEAIGTPDFEDEYIAEAEREQASQPQREDRPAGRKVELVQALNGHLARKAEEANALAREKAAKSAAFGDGAKPADPLDLGAFAAPVPANRPEPPKPPQARTAIEKLRAVPAAELSLVQMVERLALALHERQEAAQVNRAARPSPRRDAELAEALKTLAKFTETGFDTAKAGSVDEKDESEREMRDALATLQRLRGAA